MMVRDEGGKVMVGDDSSFGDYFLGLSMCRHGFDALGYALDFLKGLDGFVLALGGRNDGEVLLLPAERVRSRVIVGAEERRVLAVDAQRGLFTHSNIIMGLGY
jgi:hypothetical protein